MTYRRAEWRPDGTRVEWWCEPPPPGVPYAVTEQEWHGETCRILAINLGGPDAQAGAVCDPPLAV